LAVAESVDADLTVVGPEAPLVAGVVDTFRARGRAIFGPTAEAARLEGSKVFAKNFLQQSGIPTAAFVAAPNIAEASRALDRFSYPVVIKADGLAAGKGVVVAADRAAAEAALISLKPPFVIEEFLTGEEVSYIVLSDGRNVIPLEPTQDHKAVFDGDTGPNTGGMGAYCYRLHRLPLRRIDDDLRRPQSAGVQRPPGRSGNPTHHAPHADGPCTVAAGGRAK
jgi:phosphoribosylamine--glycine ligase